MQRHLANENGSGLMAAIVSLTLIAIMGMAVTNVMDTDAVSASNELQDIQALQVGNAGIQYALDKIDNGENPTVVDKKFDQGKFSVSTDPVAGTVTVTSQVGDAKKVQVLGAKFSNSCVTLDVTPTFTTGEYLEGMELIKNCNAKATVTSMSLSWNWGSCVQAVECPEDQDDDGEDSGDNHGQNKVTLCHVPPGNHANAHTITVGSSAVTAHLNHGDTLGACAGTVTSTPVVCEVETECSTVDGSAHIGSVKFDEHFLAQGVSISSGIEINTEDYDLVENRAYVFNGFMFDKSIPAETEGELIINFADGSHLSKSFLFGTVEAAASEAVPGTVSDPVPAPISLNNGYQINTGTVTVTANKKVDVKVLGSEITCGAGGKLIDVMVALGINNSFSNLFDNKDVNGGEVYSTTTAANNTNFVVRGKASLKSCNNFSATYDSTNTTQVKTLTNGQQAPALQGFGGQKPVSTFLAPYLDAAGKVKLATNQVIQLFELGTNGNGGAASGADFQDLVVLLTITQ